MSQQTSSTKKMFKALTASATSLGFLLQSASLVFAQIYNPALDANSGLGGSASDFNNAKSGAIFAQYFIRIWQFIIFVGGLAVLVYLIWGAFDWIIAGGDQSKISKGRDRMVQAVIGMILLAGSFVIIQFINSVFFEGTIDLLNISF